MKKPTLEEAKQYVIEKELDIDVEYWWHSNESRGWVVVIGKTFKPMENWKSNIHTWCRNSNRYKGSQSNGDSFREKYNSSKQEDK